MLQRLYITNYAIIDSIQIEFSNHLNVITGETGAGKSILMGALGLILGERADTSVLRNKEEKCIIEGVFVTSSKVVKEFFESHDLDYAQEVIVRREISVAGKSRSFLNDTPVTLTHLRQLSSLLVDLHQQFDTLELNSNDFQREVMDALAGSSGMLSEYQHVYKEYRNISKKLADLRNEQLVANKELDYNRFLWQELEDGAFKENEIEETESELKLMSNSENIKLTLSSAYFELEENEPAIVQQIKQIQHKIEALNEVFPETGPLGERLQSALIEIQDIASEIEILNDKVFYDAEKIEELNNRVTLGYNLFKKHNVLTTAQLLEIKESLEVELDKVTNLEHEIEANQKEAEALYKKAGQLAETISRQRSQQIKPFETKVNELLAQVGMPNARIKVSITPGELNAFGKDEIAFLFNANKSAAFEPIRKVASGGELSRLMLIIKSLVARKVQLPTLIFDEIDSGISGEAARQVGAIIKNLSTDHQLISITHQPQIAAKANTHFFVYKDQKAGKVVTLVKILSEQERITEIATMLSGSKPTAAAFENAREMMVG